MARSLAMRFRYRGEDLDDLLQVAAVGLVKAIDRFDPSRGNHFPAYAAPTIVGELKRHFRKTWSVHVPRRVQDTSAEIARAIRRLSQGLGRLPTVHDIESETGLSNDDVLDVLDAWHAYQSDSLDTFDDDGPEAPLLGRPDRELGRVEDRVDLESAMRRLTARDRRIIHLRFYEGLTQTEIARQVGISQMQVSRLISSSLAKIRAELESGAESSTGAADLGRPPSSR